MNAPVSRKAHKPGLSASPETMERVLARIAADPKVPSRRAGEIRSGVVTICRALGTTPDMVPADPRYFAERASRLTPGLTRLKAGRLRNSRSLVQAALDYAGRIAIRRRSTDDMGPEFKALYQAVTEKAVRIRLGRFFRFASALGASPADVTTALFDRFLYDLSESGIPAAKKIDREARIAWNKATAIAEGWPQTRVVVPSYTDHYVLKAEAFPSSFIADIKAYIATRRHNSAVDPLELLDVDELFDGQDHKSKKRAGPVRESTAKLIEYQLRQFASVLVNETLLPIEQITGLAAIVDPPLVKQGLQALIRRVKDHRNSQIFGIATVVAMAARHWVKLPDKACAHLDGFTAKVRPQHQGLPASARRSLAPFRDLENVRRFLTLPGQVFAELAKIKNPTRADANVAAAALWIAIAQRVPLRISNLVSIDLEKNLLRAHAGKNAPCALFFDADVVKNDKPIEAPLPPRLVNLLDTFVGQYRGLLSDSATTTLFPARNGTAKKPNTMSAMIQKLMKRELGFTVNPHSFRHVAAMLYLSVHRDAYHQVQLLLGHRKLETTIKYYCEIRAEDAFKHFDEVLLKLAKEGSDV